MLLKYSSESYVTDSPSSVSRGVFRSKSLVASLVLVVFSFSEIILVCLFLDLRFLTSMDDKSSLGAELTGKITKLLIFYMILYDDQYSKRKFLIKIKY